MRTHDGRYTGWAPWVVIAPRLARKVRAALEWRAGLSRPVGLTRQYSGDFVRANYGFLGPSLAWGPLPFGWSMRKILGRDCVEVAPRWYFLPRDIAALYWRFCGWAVRVGMLELREEGGYYSEGRWWPSAPRFE